MTTMDSKQQESASPEHTIRRRPKYDVLFDRVPITSPVVREAITTGGDVVPQLIWQLAQLSTVERMNIMSRFCPYCYSPVGDNGCLCWMNPDKRVVRGG